MTILVVLVLLALLFGAGAVLEGIAWMFLIVVALRAAAAFFGWSKFRQPSGAR